MQEKFWTQAVLFYPIPHIHQTLLQVIFYLFNFLKNALNDKNVQVMLGITLRYLKGAKWIKEFEYRLFLF